MNASDVKKFISRMEDLPTLPSLQAKIRFLVESPNPSITELERLIAYDQILTERVIRVANSPSFGHPGRLLDINQAVMFLGLDRIKDIIIGLKVMKFFPPLGSFNMKSLWMHCYEVALIASTLSEFVIMSSSRECFLAGLLHDIGRIVFYQMDYKRFSLISTQEDMLEKELTIFGCNHAEAGAWFAEKAGMPQEIIQTIRYHHNPSKAEEFKEVVSIVSLSEGLSRMLDPCIEDDGLWTKEHDVILLELELDRNMISEASEKLKGAKKEARNYFES